MFSSQSYAPDNKIPQNGTVDELTKSFNQADSTEKKDLFNQLDFEEKRQLFCQLNFEEKRRLYNYLGTDDKQKLFEQLGPQEQQNISGVKPPGQQVSDWLWIIVVVSFACVLIGAFLSIAISVDRSTNPAANFQLLLTMFTSAVGFMAGLLVPSPTRSNPTQGGR